MKNQNWIHLTDEQWEELYYLDDIMPKFYVDIQKLKLKLKEFMYDDVLDKCKIVNTTSLTYHEFEYKVKLYHENADEKFSSFIILNEDNHTPVRPIVFDNHTGLFYQTCSTGSKLESPKKILKEYLLKRLETLLEEPCDDFQVQLVDPKNKMRTLIHKYFD